MSTKMLMMCGAQEAAPSQVVFESTTTGGFDGYSWTVPDGVSHVCVAAVSPGGNGGDWGGSSATGGKGGDFGWANEIPVTPGTKIIVQFSSSGAQIYSRVSLPNGAGDLYVYAGQASVKSGAFSSATVYSGGSSASYSFGGGGGGAGGYTGAGGNGQGSGSGTAGGGGAGGGGGREYGGGGVALRGQGPNGTYSSGSPGGGGSGGSAGIGKNGGNYGGGGAGGRNGSTDGGVGGKGAVRILWGGGRSYPNNAADL